MPSPAQTGDGIDNDCDGSVDEETCDNIGEYNVTTMLSLCIA